MSAPAEGQAERYQKLEERLARRQLIADAEAADQDKTRLGEEDAADVMALEKEELRKKMALEAEEKTQLVSFLKESKRAVADAVVVGSVASEAPSSSVLGGSLETKKKKQKGKAKQVTVVAKKKRKVAPAASDALSLLGAYNQ